MIKLESIFVKLINSLWKYRDKGTDILRIFNKKNLGMQVFWYYIKHHSTNFYKQHFSKYICSLHCDGNGN